MATLFFQEKTNKTKCCRFWTRGFSFPVGIYVSLACAALLQVPVPRRLDSNSGLHSSIYPIDGSHITDITKRCLYIKFLVGGWATPLKNMSSSVGMMKFPRYGKIIQIDVPNQQPAIVPIKSHSRKSHKTQKKKNFKSPYTFVPEQNVSFQLQLQELCLQLATCWLSSGHLRHDIQNGKIRVTNIGILVSRINSTNALTMIIGFATS